jgi:hypothetical protein
MSSEGCAGRKNPKSAKIHTGPSSPKCEKPADVIALPSVGPDRLKLRRTALFVITVTVHLIHVCAT